MNPHAFRMRQFALGLLASVLLLLIAPGIKAQTAWWVGAGDWFIPTNWSIGTPMGGPPGVPDSTMTAIINGAPATNSFGAPTCAILFLGLGDPVHGPGTGTLSESGGALVIGSDLKVGDILGIGHYTLSGGSITTGAAEKVGYIGIGTFEQFAGTTNTVGTDLLVGAFSGSIGTYTLHDGTLMISGVLAAGIVGSGTFIQMGGSSSSTSVVVGDTSTGSYSLSGGTASSTGTFVVGNSGVGTFLQSGGTLTGGAMTVGAKAAAGPSSATLSGGTFKPSSLTIGDAGAGSMTQTGGAATISGDLILANAAGSSGTYTLDTGAAGAMDGLFPKNTIVGKGAAATFTHTSGNHLLGGNLTVGMFAGAASTYKLNGGKVDSTTLYVGNTGIGVVTQTAGTMEAMDQYIGFGMGGKGTYTQSGGTNMVDGSLYVGKPAGSTGLYELKPGATLMLTGDGHISDRLTPGGGAVGTGTFTMDTGTISPVGAATPTLFVHGSKAKLTGTGTFGTAVQYESDAMYGAAMDQSVNVKFAAAQLKTGSTFTVAQGLTAANSGPAAGAGFSPNGTFNVKWGDGGFPDVDYTPGAYAGMAPDPRPIIQVPFDPADVSGNDFVPQANVLPRVRLLQFGQTVRADTLNGSPSTAGAKPGQIRNITESVDQGKNVVQGRSLNVGGNFDLAADGQSVTPVHQDPNIAALQGGAYTLTGNGVLMGQLEPGLPYLAHGAFDDWSNADPTVRRASILAPSVAPAYNGSDAHATRVASIMVGYDPLGIQVDGQSVMETAANQYNSGFGFTGVAPRAQLRSLAGTSVGDFQTLATTAAMKVINMSFGVPGSNATAGYPLALSIDRTVEAKGLIVTKSAGNGGPGYNTITDPGGTYNGIVVGNARFDELAGGVANPHPTHFDVAHAKVNPASSRGPTGDAQPRSKPDLVAQGNANLAAFTMEASGETINDPAYGEEGNRGLYSTRARNDETATGGLPADKPTSGTSFAAPTVAGVAALMVEQARTLKNASAEDPRVIKSILQTTASKPAGWQTGYSGAAHVDSTQIPLSYDWGAGLLNPKGAVDLLRALSPADFDNISSSGWVFDRFGRTTSTTYVGTSGILPGDMYRLTGLPAGQPLTLTLNWYSHVTSVAGVDTRQTLSNLILELYTFDDNMKEWLPLAGGLSDSRADNLQHVYIPSLANAGDVLVQVDPLNNMFPVGVSDESFGLSWTMVPEPSGLLVVILIFGLAARRRRAIAMS